MLQIQPKQSKCTFETLIFFYYLAEKGNVLCLNGRPHRSLWKFVSFSSHKKKYISEEKTSVESLTKKLWIKKFESEKVSSKLTQIMTANAEKALAKYILKRASSLFYRIMSLNCFNLIKEIKFISK